MRVIQSVGVFSVAKIMGLIQAMLGLILAPVFILTFVIGAAAGNRSAPIGGAVAIVIGAFMPVFYGFVGFVFGAVGAALYNLFAKWVGGIEVNVAAFSPVPYPLQPPGSFLAQTT
jgi:hypothetical protein